MLPSADAQSETSSTQGSLFRGFDPEAQQVFIEWSEDMHRGRMPGEDEPIIRQHLAKFDKLYVWAPSGATSFTGGATQVKKLADQGLHYSGAVFRIPVNHKKAKP